MAEPLNIDELLYARLLTIRPGKSRRRQLPPQPAASRRSPSRRATSLDPFDDANAELAAERARNHSGRADSAAASFAADSRPPHYWTWRVLAAGFSAAEACQRSATSIAQSLVEHVLAAASEGCAVDPSWVFSPASSRSLGACLRTARQLGRPRMVLPGGISRAEAELYLLTLRSKAGVHGHSP